jgi:molecular chaperone GrpE (heat shock protein)
MTTLSPMTPAQTDKQASIAQNKSNGYDAFMKQVTALGGDAARGMDALPRLARAVTEASLNGHVVDDYTDAKGNKLNKNDAGADKHIRHIYRAYKKAEGKAASNKNTDAEDAQISKLNQFVKLGKLPNVAPLEVLDRARDIRNKVAETNPGKVKSAYAYFVDVARKQIKENEDNLDDATLEGIAFTSQTSDDAEDTPAKRKANAAEKLMNAYKAIDKAGEMMRPEPGTDGVAGEYPADISKALDELERAMKKHGIAAPARISADKAAKEKAQATSQLAKLVTRAREMGLSVEELKAILG